MLLSGVQMDQFRDLAKRVLLEEAPNSDMERIAEEWWADEGNVWFLMARLVANMSPSLFRVGDHAAWVRCVKFVVSDFYFELLKPAQRLQQQDKPEAYAKLT